MPTNNQSFHTRYVVLELQKARLASGYTWADMAYHLEHGHHYRITPDEYRAIEQGLTKRVPLDVLLYAASILNRDATDLLSRAQEQRIAEGHGERD